MMSIVNVILSFLEGSLLNIHTYVGVFLGAVFAPVWVNIWAWLKAKIVAADPSAAPIVQDVTNVANAVVADVTPVADVVNNAVTSKAAKPKSK